MKNNIVLVLLVILIGIASGLGLLYGIDNAVQVATFPLVERINEIAQHQKAIEKKLDANLVLLKGINNRLKSLPASAQRQPSQAQAPSEDLNKIYDIPVGDSVIIGKKDAPVTIAMFSDLQCPFCGRFYLPLKEAAKAYPDKVRYILKNFPLSFHGNAKPAAKMSLAAREQGKYIEMVEQLLENGASVADDKVKEYAQKLGLNYDKLKADLKANDAAYEKQVNEETELGNKSDVRGTPTFFINGKKTMARDAASFKTAVDNALGVK